MTDDATADEEAPELAAEIPVAEDGEKSKPKGGRVQEFLVEYGGTGIAVMLTLSALTYLGFALAFFAGFEVDGAGQTAGVLAAAGAGWVLTKPIRIPLAIALTPLVVRVVRRIRGPKSP